MATKVTKPAAAKSGNATKQVLDTLKGMKDGLDAVRSEVEELKKPVYKHGHPAGLFHATSGPVGKDSEPYSFMRAVAWAQKWLDRDACKLEADTHDRLKTWLKSQGFKPHHEAGSILVPFSTRHLPPAETSEQERIVTETKARVKAWGSQVDPDEAAWVNKQIGGTYTKALGTLSDTAGGVLVGFPTLGELIDLQRNLEAFAAAGCSETTLPPNGRIQYPKLTGGATAYWVGEAASVTDSTQTTGYLDLIAKKLGILVKLNNELLRFTSATTEGMVRLDMARVAALKADLAMLEGTGGTQIKGLITYDSASSWTPNTDKLIVVTASTTGGSGDTFEPEDVQRMIGALPDMVPEPTAWLMRKDMWSAILNRRADAATAGDQKGGFVFSLMRELGQKMQEQLQGYKVVRTSQISAARVKGGGSTLTYILTGYFPDWVVGRFGVMEFLSSGLGDTPLQNDQTWLRGIQHIDAGPRHASSFVLIDQLLRS